MSKKYTTNFLEDTNGSTGSANQVLVSTAAGIDWVDGSGSGIIGGPYLPLAGGTLTGNTNLTGSTKKLILNSGAQLGFEDATPTGTIYLYNDGAATSRLNIGGTMWVEEAGNVGIGTTSPGYKLQVGDTGAGDGNIAMKANGSGADAGAKLTFNMDVGGGNTNSYIAQIVPISYDSLSSGTHNSLNFKVGTWNNNADAGVSRMTILSNGKVGIGTTDPQAPLVISNSSTDGLEFHNSISSNSRIISYKRSNNTFRPLRLEALTHIFGISGNEKMRIDSAGNVGIGTTSPGSGYAYDIKLDIVAPQLGGIPLRLIRDSSVVNYGAMLALAAKNSASEIITYGAITGGIIDSTDGSEDGYFSIRTIKAGVEAEKVRVDESGNVGIGTTNPGAKLDVKDGSSAMRFQEYSNGASLFLDGADGDFIGGDYFNISAYGATDLAFGYGAVTKMVMKSTGNVGIGTTSPTFKLDVTGDGIRNTRTTAGWAGWFENTGSSSGVIVTAGVDSGDAPLLIRKQDGTELFSVRGNGVSWFNGGNVGIGTTSPVQKFDVSGNIASNSIYLYDSTSNDRLVLDLDASDNLQIATGTSTGSRGITFFTENSEKMRITSTGNVGIGTTSPSTELSVNGAISAITSDYVQGTTGSRLLMHSAGTGNSHSYIQVQSSGGASNAEDLALQLYGGNVGIGTSSPGEKLEVSGNAKAETLIATDLTDGYVPYSKSGTLGLQDSKIYTQGAGIGVGTTTLAAGCHITSLSNISATGYRVSAMQTAPSSRGDTGTLGEIRITADYIYVCYATNSWRRVAIAQW